VSFERGKHWIEKLRPAKGRKQGHLQGPEKTGKTWFSQNGKPQKKWTRGEKKNCGFNLESVGEWS